MPGVSRSSSASFSLWVPYLDLSGDAAWWFPQYVANPCPFPLFNLYVYGVLVCSLPKILISDFVEPSDVHDFSMHQIKSERQR
jgi:hypothetical protein